MAVGDHWWPGWCILAHPTVFLLKLSYKTQRELELIEAALPKLEEKKLELETKLAEGITEYNEIQKISEELKSIAEELDEKSTRWLEIQEEV